MIAELGTRDVPEEHGPRSSVARQQRLERREEPRAGQIPGQGRLAPRSLGLPGRGGAGTPKVAVADRVKPGGARPATHLSRVGRRADTAAALRQSCCGPRRVAGAQPSHRQPESGGDGHRPGLGGDPEPLARARDSARSSLPPSPRFPAQLPPAVRSGLWGAARGPRSRGRGSAWGCGHRGRMPPSLRSGRAGSAERNGSGRSAPRTVPSLSARPPWRRGAVTQS